MESFCEVLRTAGDVRTGAALLALAGMVFGGVALGRGNPLLAAVLAGVPLLLAAFGLILCR